MGYNFTVSDYYRVKETKEYPWPCKPAPDRTLVIYADDVLQKVGPGVYNKVTGLGTMNHQIPDEDTILCKDPITLRMGGLWD